MVLEALDKEKEEEKGATTLGQSQVGGAKGEAGEEVKGEIKTCLTPVVAVPDVKEIEDSEKPGKRKEEKKTRKRKWDSSSEEDSTSEEEGETKEKTKEKTKKKAKKAKIKKEKEKTTEKSTERHHRGDDEFESAKKKRKISPKSLGDEKEKIEKDRKHHSHEHKQHDEDEVKKNKHGHHHHHHDKKGDSKRKESTSSPEKCVKRHHEEEEVKEKKKTKGTKGEESKKTKEDIKKKKCKVAADSPVPVVTAVRVESKDETSKSSSKSSSEPSSKPFSKPFSEPSSEPSSQPSPKPSIAQAPSVISPAFQAIIPAERITPAKAATPALVHCITSPPIAAKRPRPPERPLIDREFDPEFDSSEEENEDEGDDQSGEENEGGRERASRPDKKRRKKKKDWTKLEKQGTRKNQQLPTEYRILWVEESLNLRLPSACGRCEDCLKPPCLICKGCLRNAELERRRDILNEKKPGSGDKQYIQQKRRCEKLECTKLKIFFERMKRHKRDISDIEIWRQRNEVLGQLGHLYKEYKSAVLTRNSRRDAEADMAFYRYTIFRFGALKRKRLEFDLQHFVEGAELFKINVVLPAHTREEYRKLKEKRLCKKIEEIHDEIHDEINEKTPTINSTAAANSSLPIAPTSIAAPDVSQNARRIADTPADPNTSSTPKTISNPITPSISEEPDHTGDLDAKFATSHDRAMFGLEELEMERKEIYSDREKARTTIGTTIGTTFADYEDNESSYSSSSSSSDEEELQAKELQTLMSVSKQAFQKSPAAPSVSLLSPSPGATTAAKVYGPNSAPSKTSSEISSKISSHAPPPLPVPSTSLAPELLLSKHSIVASRSIEPVISIPPPLRSPPRASQNIISSGSPIPTVRETIRPISNPLPLSISSPLPIALPLPLPLPLPPLLPPHQPLPLPLPLPLPMQCQPPRSTKSVLPPVRQLQVEKSSYGHISSSGHISPLAHGYEIVEANGYVPTRPQQNQQQNLQYWPALPTQVQASDKSKYLPVPSVHSLNAAKKPFSTRPVRSAFSPLDVTSSAVTSSAITSSTIPAKPYVITLDPALLPEGFLACALASQHARSQQVSLEAQERVTTKPPPANILLPQIDPPIPSPQQVVLAPTEPLPVEQPRSKISFVIQPAHGSHTRVRNYISSCGFPFSI